MHTVQIDLVLLYYHRGICTIGAIDLVQYLNLEQTNNVVSTH